MLLSCGQNFLTEVVDCSKESADSMFVGWSGHGNFILNCNRVGLKTICGDDMTHEGCLTDKEFHFVDIKFYMLLLKPFKHSDKVLVMVDSGFCVSSMAAQN